MKPSPSSDRAIQAYLRVAAGHGRETVQIGPFLATFAPQSANPYLNYAMPDDDAVPSPADIATLIAACRQRDRVPRLEFLPTLAPAVEPALVAAGFVVEGRLPLMVCPLGLLNDVPPPDGIVLAAPTTDADILGMVAAQNEAYGEGPPTSEVIASLRANLAAGELALLARDVATGLVVGGGVCTIPTAQTTELAGVGVRTPFRRRGIAAALTAQLARDAFAAGLTTVFLMAAGDAEARIYARVGFVTTGVILHISLPQPKD
jgi:ribosomal protein S18 acetylase RimI-like enzyme